MVKKNFLMTAPLLMASFCSAQEKPNVVLIMVDDMGYSDIGCYGGEILTPNIDALASKGVRFTQFYNTSRSCPARASLMIQRIPQPQLCHNSRSSERRRLPYLYGR